LLLSLPLGVGAQARHRLTGGEIFPEAFGSTGPVRELSDGRLMVPDPLGRVLVLLDFETGTADTLAHPGPGPQEYDQPDALYALVGDSTLLVDLGNARLTVIDPEGGFLKSIPMGQRTTSGVPLVVLPGGVDRWGRLFFRSEVGPGGKNPVSVPLLRFDPASGVLDTLANLAVPELPPPPLPGESTFRGKAAEPQDVWAVGPDGQVAIIRCGGYSVTWLDPDGGILEGPEYPVETVRIGNAEKLLWLEENAAARITMRTDDAGKVRVYREDEGGTRAVDALYAWPSVFPTVKPRRAQVAPDGTLWIERYMPAGHLPLLDRFDPSGRKVGEVELPAGRRLAGFGKGHVYLVHTDRVGLHWIERYRSLP